MQKNLTYITYFSIYFALTLVIQMLGFPQPITGPLINMMLFLAVMHLGPGAGVLLGIFTPLVALWRGELPIFLAPMVPFIMIGNALLVLGFYLATTKLRLWRQRAGRNWRLARAGVGIVSGALLKFVFFLLGIGLVMPLMIKDPAIQKVASTMLSFAQLITATIGGVLALVVLHFLQKARIVHESAG